MAPADDDRDPVKDPKPGGGKEARRERQAKALRENLARRKAQSRARAGQAGEGREPEDGGAG